MTASNVQSCVAAKQILYIFPRLGNSRNTQPTGRDTMQGLDSLVRPEPAIFVCLFPSGPVAFGIPEYCEEYDRTHANRP